MTHMFAPGYIEPLKFSGMDAIAEGWPAGEHLIKEPSAKQIADFWTDYISMVTKMQADARDELAAEARKADEPEPKETVKQRDTRIRREVMAGQHSNMEFGKERNRILSALCSTFPSAEMLDALPGRWQVAFEAYLIGSLRPEVSSSATT